MLVQKEVSQTKSILPQLQESLDHFLLEGLFRSTPVNGITYANTALVEMFGYSSMKELQNASDGSLYGDEEGRTFLIDKMKSEGIIVKQRVLYRRKDFSTFWGCLTCRKLIRDGIEYFEGRIHDISEQVQLEQTLRQKENELDKLKDELDKFIYSASHDIRSPISTLMGILNLMKLDTQGECTKDYIKMLETSTTKLDQFVRQLASYAHNHKKNIQDELIDFNTIISELLLGFKENHPNYNSVDVSISMDNKVSFYSDIERMKFILGNILKNGLDYCDQKKLTKIITVEIRTELEKVSIEVFDNGLGIASTQVDRVFDMFYRATSVSKGSGLGLFIARDTVIKLGGIITLNSSYGIGTTVKVEIPNSKKGKLIEKKNQLRPKLLSSRS